MSSARDLEAARLGSEAWPPELRSLLRLFMASARNVWRRSLVALAYALGAAPFLGWWAGGWVVAIVSLCVVEAHLVRHGVLERMTAAQFRITFTSVVSASSVSHAGLAAALWFSGAPVAQALALMVIGANVLYGLMHYHAFPDTCRWVVGPSVAAMVAITVDLMTSAPVPTFGAWAPLPVLAALVYVFVTSRQQLASSSMALRLARTEAREQAAVADAASQAKGAFLATMSHEIRTPLNGVMGMAQVMAADELADRQRSRLEIISQSGEALLCILNDVLDFAKIEAGRIELESIEFNLSDLVTGVFHAFTGVAAQKGLTFEYDIEAAAGRYLGDPARLRQILGNLLSNALKFTAAGEVRLSADVTDMGLTITVRDTGPGIAAEDLPKLFQKFDQIGASTNRQFGGTGLGLAICRDLAVLMGGQVRVESERGVGSSFSLDVPLRSLGPEVARATSAKPAGAQAALSLRVLAADDNAVNQLVLSTLLEQLGVDLTMVDNGQAAVEAWAAGDWDLVLMDIQMPVLDGVSATREIRRLERATGRPRTPILALSADAMSHQVIQYQEAGMDGHVAKPIRLAELVDAMQACLSSEASSTGPKGPLTDLGQG